MLRFRGFKASLNFNSGKTSGLEHYDKSPGISLNGAYRLNKDDLFGSDLYSESPKKITPSTVVLATKQPAPSRNRSRSTSNLTKPSKETENIRKSAPDIPQAANQQKVNIKEQKKLEKQRLAEQKKQDKLAKKEAQKEEKLKKEREKQIITQQTIAQNRSKKEEQKKPKKRTAPQPRQQLSSSQTQQQQTAPHTQQQQQHTAPQIQQQRISPNPQQRTAPHTQKQRTPTQSQQIEMPQTGTPSKSRTQRKQSATNTLESSISKSSGPPPYSSDPEVTPKRNDFTRNTSFVNPVEDMDSWGLISQHRQQMNRQAGVSKSAPKQKHLDLQYNVGNSSKEKSMA